MKAQDTHYIHPEDLNNLRYWSKKWGITSRQLTDAILDTGSIRTADLKEYLRKKVYASSFLSGLGNLLRNKFNH
jgi:hypothetical protein